MNKLKWTRRKPVFGPSSRACLIITASLIRDHWDYGLFEVNKLHDSDNWYWAITEWPSGEEWGDYADLYAQWYAVILPKRMKGGEG